MNRNALFLSGRSFNPDGLNGTQTLHRLRPQPHTNYGMDRFIDEHLLHESKWEVVACFAFAAIITSEKRRNEISSVKWWTHTFIKNGFFAPTNFAISTIYFALSFWYYLLSCNCGRHAASRKFIRIFVVRYLFFFLHFGQQPSTTWIG